MPDAEQPGDNGATRRVPPHVCLIAWGFPPSRASGVYRALALANAFAEGGAQVTVLTCAQHYFQLVTGTDDSLTSHIDPRIDVRTVSYDAGRLDPVITHWPLHRFTEPARYRREKMAEERAFFPERQYGPWRLALEDAVHRLQRDHSIDLVVATGNPYTAYAGAAHAADQFGVPYVLDDRDGWMLDVYTGAARQDFLANEHWLGALLDQSLEAWFVNPPIAEWHRARFPRSAGHIDVVENGWDPELLDPASTVRRVDGPPRIGFIGTINAGFPLVDVISGWRRGRESAIPVDAELHLVGPLGYQKRAQHHERLLAASTGQQVVVRGPWPKARIGEAYAELDALLFAKEGGAMVTSGKIYEYMATGKPIAVVADSEQDSRRVLADYPRVHVAESTDADAVASALAAALADAAGPDADRLERARRVGARWRRDHAVRPAVERVLTRVTSQSSRDAAPR